MTWEEMQAGELDWWRAFLARPNALPRLFALYGYRYLSYFFREFNDLGAVIDFGSGPVSAAYIADKSPALVICADPLFAAYQEARLIYGNPLSQVAVPSTNFDTALVLNVLDHTDDPATLLVAAAASLKPIGKVLLWVYVDGPADALHRCITEPDVRAWTERAGLRIVRDCRRQQHHNGPDEYMAIAVT